MKCPFCNSSNVTLTHDYGQSGAEYRCNTCRMDFGPADYDPDDGGIDGRPADPGNDEWEF